MRIRDKTISLLKIGYVMYFVLFGRTVSATCIRKGRLPFANSLAHDLHISAWTRIKSPIYEVCTYTRYHLTALFDLHMMLYTAVALILGARDEGLEHLRAKCVEAAKGIANTVDPDGREVVWNTSSAGLCALAGAHELLGYEDVGEELRTYSYKYDMTPEGRKRWGRIDAKGWVFHYHSPIDFGKQG